jgi:uncharacterized protein (TIGR02145 family)
MRRLRIGILIAIEIVLLSMGTVQSGENRTEYEGTVADVDGNAYRTITIGTQVWLVENLRVTHYRAGGSIPRIADNEEWSGLTTGAYCRPALESAAHKGSYGLLYNFHAVDDSRGLCPEGWHVPTAEEWRSLIDHLGGDQVAGGRMKETSADLWRLSVPGTSNASGFSAFPAGGRGRFGSPAEVGHYATWWASTSHDSDFAWHWGLYPDKNSIRSNPGHKSSGFSVRCIQD